VREVGLALMVLMEFVLNQVEHKVVEVDQVAQVDLQKLVNGVVDVVKALVIVVVFLIVVVKDVFKIYKDVTVNVEPQGVVDLEEEVVKEEMLEDIIIKVGQLLDYLDHLVNQVELVPVVRLRVQLQEEDKMVGEVEMVEIMVRTVKRSLVSTLLVHKEKQ